MTNEPLKEQGTEANYCESNDKMLSFPNEYNILPKSVPNEPHNEQGTEAFYCKSNDKMLSFPNEYH